MSLTYDERKELERLRREKNLREQREKDSAKFSMGLFRGLGLSYLVCNLLMKSFLWDTVEGRIVTIIISLISVVVGIGSNYYGRFKEEKY